MLSPSATPHAASCLQLSYSSVLGSIVLGRGQGTGAFAGCSALSLGDWEVGRSRCEHGAVPILLGCARLSLN